jgi:hemerythrin-like domain-containing protein
MTMPIGPLMVEHRLIERLVALLDRERERISQGRRADLGFLEIAVDFLRTYADRLHHGKEEDILFRGLAAKPLAETHRKMMDELLADHRAGRALVGGLEAAAGKHRAGDEAAVEVIAARLQDLVRLYPRHIEKEDKHFFIPAMGYLSRSEQEAMLEAERAFDRSLIHEMYGHKIDELEGKR